MQSNRRESHFVRNGIILCDFIAFNLCIALYLWLIIYNRWTPDTMLVWVFVLAANISLTIAECFFPTIIHHRQSSTDRIIRQTTLLTIICGGTNYMLTAIMYVHFGSAAPHFLHLALFTTILYIVLLLTRSGEREMLRRHRMKDGNRISVIFVGSSQIFVTVYDKLIRDITMGYTLKGYYADEEIKDAPKEMRRLGSLADLDKYIAEPTASPERKELYCSLPADDEERIGRLMDYCDSHVILFHYVTDFARMLPFPLRQEFMGETTILTPHESPLEYTQNKFIKRAFDIIVSSVVLICLLPFIPVIALIIKIQSPGPIFFRQERTGLNGRTFRCIKFRSMHVNAAADTMQATKNDVRKFAFGNFMRKANIDELPQFFNVLTGDMSIVGPRPHMLYHTDVYRKLIGRYMIRHFVKPGITGWAQVTGYRGETKELWQMEGRVERDIWYMKHWSVWLDIRIMIKTAMQIIVHDEKAY